MNAERPPDGCLQAVVTEGLCPRSLARPDRRFCGICPSDRDGLQTQNSLSAAAGGGSGEPEPGFFYSDFLVSF